MFKGAFDNTIYVRVYKNKFCLRHIESKKEIVVFAKDSFTTARLIIGQFSNAEKTLIKGIAELYKKKWFSVPPKILIQQMEMTEGGLSEVEERILQEIAAMSGAKTILVLVGKNLTDNEVINKMKKCITRDLKSSVLS